MNVSINKPVLFQAFNSFNVKSIYQSFMVGTACDVIGYSNAMGTWFHSHRITALIFFYHRGSKIFISVQSQGKCEKLS